MGKARGHRGTKARRGRAGAAPPPHSPRPLREALPGLPLKYALYELAAQAPGEMARFLHAVHGRAPRVLREDFSGTGAICRAWASLVAGGEAIAVDADPEPLLALKGVPGVRTVRKDVLKAGDTADIICAINFPVGYWHTREALVRYLAHARACLNRRGVFVCDTYGGVHAFTPGRLEQILTGPAGEEVEYTWQQREANPLTGRVVDAMHFRVREPGRARATVVRDAFVYDWRLWSIAEIRDAMRDAGFRTTEVYDRLGDAVDECGRVSVRPVEDPAELDDDYVVYIAARP